MHRQIPQLRPFTLFLVLLTGSLAGLCQRGSAQDELDRQTAKVMSRVGMLLERVHLTRRKLDDEISSRALDNLIESFDPLKLYFTAADIARFEKQRKQLDDMVDARDLSFAKELFETYEKRVDARVAWVGDLVEMDHDYGLDEEFITDGDAARWAKDDAELRDRWRKRVKYNLLRLKVDKVPDAEAKEQIKKRYQNFARRTHQLDVHDILASFLTSVSTSYDPHSTYMSARTLEDFEIRMRLNYQGIGARLSDEDGYPTVTSIMPGGAAKKSGLLKAKDRIVAVAQGDADFVDVTGMRLNDAVQMIRGKAGTVVRLKVRRKGIAEPFIIPITRAKTELQDEKALGEVFEVDSGDGKMQIGVIDLPSFYGAMGARGTSFRSCARDVGELLDGFREKKVDAVVLDLRRNGGGLMAEAVRITGMFIDQGPVVQVKGYDGEISSRDDRREGVKWDGALVVLTSKFSASASEIVAGAIQDYGRGIVVGDETTHGKGTVQQVLDIGRLGARGRSPEKLGALKLTIQQFYRPDGMSTQQRGVPSDLVLPSFTNEVGRGERDLDYSVPFNAINPQEHLQYGLAPRKLVKELSTASETRRAKDKFFVKLKKDIAAYRKRRDNKTVTLQESKYRALLAELEDDEKKVEEALENEDEIKREIERNEYLDEVLRITAEYTAGLRQRKVASKR